jgi:site-specific recombinase XerD
MTPPKDENTELVPSLKDRHLLPTVFQFTGEAERQVLEFFAAHLRNRNTRKAYAQAVADFGAWCAQRRISSLTQVRPMHVSAFVEELTTKIAPPSVKQKLTALRMLFDWLVVHQVLPNNPADAVRGPKYVVKKGKTSVLSVEETRELLDHIDTASVVGLRDRALIALLVYTFARVGAAIAMRVGDVYVQGKRTWVRLHEKGGKRHEMPAHHNLEAYLDAYITAAGLATDPKGPLFRSTVGRSGELTDRPLHQPDVYRMIGRRAAAADIRTRIGCHTFRATGITEYLRNGGKLEIAQAMANHESARTTGLYDRRQDEISLDEIERILI